MNRNITEEKFNEIKKFLNTPILVKPSICYASAEFGYSSSTISLINRFDTFKEYKNYRINSFLDNEMRFIKQEQEKAKLDIEKFNSEWFFGGEE